MSLVLLLALGREASGAAFELLWQQGFTNAPTSPRFRPSASVADGNDLIVGGSVAEPSTRAFVARISATGNIQWEYRAGEGAYQGVEGMVVDANSNVYFGAKVSWEPQRTVALIKLDSLGNEMWRATEERFIASRQTVSGLVINSTGDVFWIVSRDLESDGLGALIVISKFRPDGSRYWRTVFPKPVFVNFAGVEKLLCPLPSGGVIVTGATPIAERRGHGMVGELGSDGTVRWIAEVDYPSFFTRVHAHPSGTICASSEFGPYAVFDSSGKLIRAGRSSDHGEGFGVRSDGFLLVHRGGNQQFLIDANGNFQWRTLDSHSYELGPVLLPDGGWLAAGVPSEEPFGTASVSRYDANGNELWTETIETPPYAIPLERPSNALLIAADGTIRLVLGLNRDSPRGIGAAAFRYNDPPPSINVVSQPESAHWDGTNAVQFHVAATADAPLRYQWLAGFEPIPGATNSTLAIPSTEIVEYGPWLRAQIMDGMSIVTTRVADLWLGRIVLRLSPSRFDVHADRGVRFSVEMSRDLTTWSTFEVPFPETRLEMLEPKAFFRAVERP